jgi:hypothetical protein
VGRGRHQRKMRCHTSFNAASAHSHLNLRG